MRLIATACTLILGVAFVAPAAAATLTVTRIQDAGLGSLRQLIEQSNTNGEPDTIVFDASLAGRTIWPRSPLPPLTEGNLTINGDIDGDGTPDVALNGAEAGGAGLDVRSTGNTIRGLSIALFEKGVAIRGYRARRNTVAGCYVGLALDGATGRANQYGVHISGAAGYNTVGGTTAADRNVISGNVEVGVEIAGADYNKILGNYIGLDSAGAIPVRNGTGVMVTDSQGCRIGNPSGSGRNVISGNGEMEYWIGPMQHLDAPDGQAKEAATNGWPFDLFFGGVVILRGKGNRIAGNYIGTDATGTRAIGNAWAGVLLCETLHPTVGPNNVASGNYVGIALEYTRNARVSGNYIGVTADGSDVVPNRDGIELAASSGTLIGGTTPGERNIISGNTDDGIYVTGEGLFYGPTHGLGTESNKVLGNYIGVSPSGAERMGNGYGIYVSSTAITLWIGGSQPGSGNVISASRYSGISLYSALPTIVTRNLIGLDPSGQTRMANRGPGIIAQSQVGPVTIGGSTWARGNTIAAFRGQHGIYMLSARPGNSTIRHNLILGPSGTPVTGAAGILVNPEWSPPFLFTGDITDNRIRRFHYGMYFTDDGVRPTVARNRINACTIGIAIRSAARPNLGNLQNTRTLDDGGNVFGTLSSYAVDNRSAKNIMAEGNDWGTTSATTIDGTLIYDQLDNGSYGRVDYDPLIGGTPPSPLPPRTVQLTGVTAAPAGAGAEVVFTLSGPAEVTAEILNVAGRPVAQLPTQSAEAGLNRLTWNATSAAGTQAPAGTYLVRVRARTASGEQASAIAPLQLGR